ncbi:GNAT family N-acetyltransferase [Pelagimonas varians]|uniref:N-acetyltransferase domain-containing protein n=1 Tax=Pelagimonas varians TaxID=696760 RepID=A0A238JUN0_9RHOB|nr:GNAT family N-acetyltransferase [Pelagimonas varians]PYG34397.1 acetyltransferase (GNAT) family protein [Pelagimonas varians]SMX34193.1 hypothetical protein PEV8663_00419 [Pelagimonas varians]
MKSLHLATEDDMPKLLPLVTAFHLERGFNTTQEGQTAAIAPLLAGSPHGAIWLIGPRKAPVGYITVTFGWSLEFGGMDAFVDELYIRPAVRKRGMGTETLVNISKALGEGGVRALHLEVDREDEDTQRLYKRSRFALREKYVLMSKEL